MCVCMMLVDGTHLSVSQTKTVLSLYPVTVQHYTADESFRCQNSHQIILYVPRSIWMGIVTDGMLSCSPHAVCLEGFGDIAAGFIHHAHLPTHKNAMNNELDIPDRSVSLDFAN